MYYISDSADATILFPQITYVPGDIKRLRPKQNGCSLADIIFKCILLNENCCILIQIPLKFAPEVPINNKPALVQITAWHQRGAKPLSDQCWPSLLTDIMHIYITHPWWVNQQVMSDPHSEKLINEARVPPTCTLSRLTRGTMAKYSRVSSLLWSV